ncbi:nitrate reductase molybdenum cofactor assembly chaperone [Streptomyces sp. NPDC101150]|uniref:nitrate reductase molybdenum cofactor assembly chaperone n=1 Tax=Streptomyces sp. NPDC101150 TaxID=3366114 RepID=UPI00382D818E
MSRQRAVHQAASLLLGYPDASWPQRVGQVAAAVGRLDGTAAGLLLRFCRETASVPLLDLAARYVTTFDRSRRRTLHLTHYTDGDTRRRGASLAALKARYRAHGWEPADGELPDFLPAVLEFAARCPEAGTALLDEHCGSLDLLLRALDDHHSPYAHVVRAVRSTVPGRRAAVPVPDMPGPVPFPFSGALGDEGVRR